MNNIESYIILYTQCNGIENWNSNYRQAIDIMAFVKNVANGLTVHWTKWYYYILYGRMEMMLGMLRLCKIRPDDDDDEMIIYRAFIEIFNSISNCCESFIILLSNISTACNNVWTLHKHDMPLRFANWKLYSSLYSIWLLIDGNRVSIPNAMMHEKQLISVQKWLTFACELSYSITGCGVAFI